MKEKQKQTDTITELKDEVKSLKEAVESESLSDLIKGMRADLTLMENTIKDYLEWSRQNKLK